jgi:hypothetical protein
VIRRTYSVEEVTLGTDQILSDIKERFRPEEWLSDRRNIAMVNDNGDIAAFEPHGSEGVFKGHYFFQSRGAEAVKAAKEFLSEAFSEYDIHRLMGFTQVSKKGAMWITRHLGFTPLGIENINGEDFQVWTMHRSEYHV